MRQDRAGPTSLPVTPHHATSKPIGLRSAKRSMARPLRDLCQLRQQDRSALPQLSSQEVILCSAGSSVKTRRKASAQGVESASAAVGVDHAGQLPAAIAVGSVGGLPLAIGTWVAVAVALDPVAQLKYTDTP